MKCIYCERPARAKKMCTTHYERRRSGAAIDEPVALRRKYSDDERDAIIKMARARDPERAAKEAGMPITTLYRWLRARSAS